MNEDFAKHEYDFSFIIGLDNANTFDKWVNYEELERMARFVVVPRKGINRDPNVTWYLSDPHIYLSPDNDIPDISSTVVRETLEIMDNLDSFGGNPQDEMAYDEAEKFVQENVDRNVLAYINDQGLYHADKVEA
jgi:nicotinic acid mononucleotide adenylyltransferase